MRKLNFVATVTRTTSLLMKKTKCKNWNLLIPTSINENDAKEVFNKIQIGDFEVVEILKDTYRSQVKRISVMGRDLVLKIPNEKNTRLWIRLLTWFRIGEAYKNLKGMQLLQEKNILTTTPVLAAEKRNSGMVVDSWLLYEFLEGKSCVEIPSSHQKVVSALGNIHKAGLLHGDPQIRNFVIYKEEIYTIDSNPKRIGFKGFDVGYEWAYLRKSYPEIERYFGGILHSNWYKFAVEFDLLDRKIAHFRKRIKGLFKSS